MRSGHRERGMSLLEMTVATGIAGALGLAGLGSFFLPSPSLAIATQEIQGSLDQAFCQAQASGQSVEVSASRAKDLGHLPVSLPRDLHWGLPAGTPLPPGEDPATRAAATGEAHAAITVTPRHTATATVWFLNDGADALCIRVNDRGRVSTLRWRAAKRRWGRA